MTAVQIYEIEGGSRPRFHADRFSAILGCIKDASMPVAVVSVNGIKRSGKSFLLSLLAQYLTQSGNNQENWLQCHFAKDSTQSRSMFDWAGGSERSTVGIWVSSTPIVVRAEDGQQQVTVVLMDTQGSFDDRTSFTDNALIFATSVWLSALFLYNVRSDLSEDKVQMLEYLTKFALDMRPDQSTRTAFAHLLLLIRDWAWPIDYAYGSQGGFTAEFVQSADETSNHFQTVSSFLLPHPGLALAQNEGKTLPPFKQLQPHFTHHLQALLTEIRADILQAQSLPTAGTLLGIVRQWKTLIESGKALLASTLTQTAAEAKLQRLLQDSEEHLHALCMKEFMDPEQDLSDQQFAAKYAGICEQVLVNFQKECRAVLREGADSISATREKWLDQLRETAADKRELWKELNAARRVKRDQDRQVEGAERGLAAMAGQLSKHDEDMRRLRREVAEKLRIDAEDRKRLLTEIASVRESLASVPSWVRPSSAATLPPGAFLAGHDGRFGVYVARGPIGSGTIPGKYLTDHPHAHIPWGGQEHLVSPFQLLVVPNPSRLRWVACSGGSVPSTPSTVPIVGGVSESGEILYVARVTHAGATTVGKVHRSHGVAYISYGGEEYRYYNYEVLTLVHST